MGVQVAENGPVDGERRQNPSQISRDHHVAHSLLHTWWHLYQEGRKY